MTTERTKTIEEYRDRVEQTLAEMKAEDDVIKRYHRLPAATQQAIGTLPVIFGRTLLSELQQQLPQGDIVGLLADLPSLSIAEAAQDYDSVYVPGSRIFQYLRRLIS